jgi:L-asparaginase II
MAEILVEVTRGNVAETIHRGDIAVVKSDGTLIHEVGDAYKYTYMRSAAKPIQAMNVILSGTAGYFQFSSKEIAIMCASHYAENEHINTVQGILDKIGLTRESILAGKSRPLSKEVDYRYAWENKSRNELFNDCSGKHAGILAVCKKDGYPLTDYTSVSHPVQQEILQLMSEITGYPQEKIALGIDGCSVPVHAMPLYNMALGYARMVTPGKLADDKQEASQQIADAMISHPFMIAGTNGFCTELIKHSNGKLIGKVGAAGIYCVGIKEKEMGIAVKIENGSMEVLPPVVMQILDDMNILTDEELSALSKFRMMNNYNDVQHIVGYMKPAFHLT